MAKVKVNITMDDDLMRRIDEYADEAYTSRSGLITLACSQFLASAEVTKAIKSMALAMRKIADSGEIDDQSRKEMQP